MVSSNFVVGKGFIPKKALSWELPKLRQAVSAEFKQVQKDSEEEHGHEGGTSGYINSANGYYLYPDPITIKQYEAVKQIIEKNPEYWINEKQKRWNDIARQVKAADTLKNAYKDLRNKGMLHDYPEYMEFKKAYTAHTKKPEKFTVPENIKPIYDWMKTYSPPKTSYSYWGYPHDDDIGCGISIKEGVDAHMKALCAFIVKNDLTEITQTITGKPAFTPQEIKKPYVWHGYCKESGEHQSISTYQNFTTLAEAKTWLGENKSKCELNRSELVKQSQRFEVTAKEDQTKVPAVAVRFIGYAPYS